MKKKLSKILIVLMLLIVVSFSASVVYANAYETNIYIQREETYIYTYVRIPQEQKENEVKEKTKKEKYADYLEDKDPIRKSTYSFLNSISSNLPNLVQAIDGGETIDIVSSSLSMISGIASCFGPYGEGVSVLINIGNGIMNAVLGIKKGEEPTSELVQMEDRLNQQFDKIYDELFEIEGQINDLSNQINESTNSIIKQTTEIIDNSDAKNYLEGFMERGEGNFSYNEFRNYIYGSTNDNVSSRTAYYALLKEAIINKESDEIIKYYYDKLYFSIIEDRDIYYSYILGNDTDSKVYHKSIAQQYYDVVSKNPDLVTEGMDAELMAIMFAYDIYQTELMASEIVSSCNLYQYIYMLLNDTDNYKYNENDIVTINDVLNMQEINEMRAKNVKKQLAYDIAYILGLSNSYVVEASETDIFEVVNNNKDTYGNVLSGWTIYLNQVPESVINLLGFEITDFYYKLSIPSDGNNVFLVSSSDKKINAELYYKDIKINEINFNVGTSEVFNGGNGEADDPYLIASAEQFKSISNALDKHYRLVCDIDFEGEEIYPLDMEINDRTGNTVYNGFTGSLYGNGYTIKNLVVKGTDHTGIFGKNSGEIADLKLYNVKVYSNITEVTESDSKFYAGMIAGENEGTIKYCLIDSDGSKEKEELYYLKSDFDNYESKFPEVLYKAIRAKYALFEAAMELVYSIQEIDVPKYGLFLNIDNEVPNKNIYSYVGGIAGQNSGDIACCTISNSYIFTSSEHSFGGNSVETNKNFVYVGGACGNNSGNISYVVVDDTTEIAAYTYSLINNGSKKKPYVEAYTGGIAAQIDEIDKINYVSSSAKILYNIAVTYNSANTSKYGNCKENENQYIAKAVSTYSPEEYEAIKATKDIKELISKTENNYSVSCEVIDSIYKVEKDILNTSNFKVLVDGVEKEYNIIDIYGLNKKDEELYSKKQEIYVLLSFEIEDKKIYSIQKLNVEIKENSIKKIEVLNIRDSYISSEFTPKDLIIKVNYEIGEPEYIRIDSENISLVKYSGNFTSVGTQTIKLEYGGKLTSFNINVLAKHIHTYVYNESLSSEATCTSIGCKVSVCDFCGDKQYVYSRKIEHEAEEAITHEATCFEEGYIEELHCKNCGTLISEKTIIPKVKDHTYESVDDKYHVCTKGNHKEPHQYTITESVKSKINEDGSESFYIVYTYKCVCKEDGFEVVDENYVNDENRKLPTIMVSDGYVLYNENGTMKNEVIVYVQLINNQEINGLNFGITYGDNLELIDYQYGSIIENSQVIEYNPKTDLFACGNAKAISGDGNLLKLTFRIIGDIKKGNTYKVIPYYSFNGDSGGVATANGKEIFLTKGGTIKVVEHIPGDVNNDGIVDLADAIEICNKITGKKEIDETYADANLDGVVDISDIIIILQYITGGYGKNILDPNYEIILNGSGYDGTLENLKVALYEGKTYSDLGLKNLERKGYKFLGWYDKIIGGNLINLNDIVKYNANQIEQTLYAHWELNTISFKSNDGSGEMPGIYYNVEDGNYYYQNGEIVTEDNIKNNLKKEYNVAFVYERISNDKKESITEERLLSYELKCWEDKKGNKYNTLKEAVISLMKQSIGKVELKAIWSTSPTITYPKVPDGYEKIQWYTDENHIPSKLITNNGAIILGRNDDNGIYKVYGKCIPIEYTIVFDLNNGQVNGKDTIEQLSGYSIENPYDLSKINITRTGYEFKCWSVSIDNNYYKDFYSSQEISYLPEAEKGSVVTLKAIWNDETDYKINYVCNDGKFDEKKAIYSYRITQVENLTLPTPIHSNYPEYVKFEGWYLDEKLTNKFDAQGIKDKPKDITLYAKWADYAEYTYIPSSVEHKDIVIFDLTNTNKIENDLNIINCKEIYFVDNSGKQKKFNIYLSSSKNEYCTQNIHLVNFELIGTIDLHKNSKCSVDVNLDCSGKSYISAPKAKEAISGIKNLKITGSGQLTITGGAGSLLDAFKIGVLGNDGATAINVENVIIDMTGSLTVYGGKGADGSDGKDQYIGRSSDGVVPDTLTTSGSNGGDGGIAIKAQKITIKNNSIVDLIGGNGGDGGDGGNVLDEMRDNIAETSLLLGGSYNGNADLPDGGDGGDGGNGGRPFDAVIYINNVASLYSRYGYGGDGGDGGHGGNAGGLKKEEFDVWPDGKGHGGNGGNGGYGIIGGNGGNGGEGGASFSYGTKNDKTGKYYGTTGNGGNGGNAGDSIYEVQVYENELVYNWYLALGTAGKGGSYGLDKRAEKNHHTVQGTSGNDGLSGNKIYNDCANKIFFLNNYS